MHAPHPSPSSCMVRGDSKGCAKEQHVSGVCLFVCFSLWEGLDYCYLLSARAAWSLQWGQPRGVAMKEGWMSCKWEPFEEQVLLKHSRQAALCYIHRCAPVILYFKSSWMIVSSSLLSFFILMPHREGWYHLSFTEKETAAKRRASKRHKVTIKPMVQPRTDSNIFQCMCHINISSSFCLCCTDWRSSMCRSLCKQSLFSPM